MQVFASINLKTKKMQEVKLTQTGQWIWRDNEISYKSFTQLSKEQKLAHLQFLVELGQENFGTNDWYIMKNFGPKDFFEEESRPFFSLLEEKSQQEILANTCTSVSIEINEIPTLEEIIENGKEYVQQYLQAFFETEYPDWETNMRFHNFDKFIINTKNFMDIDELTYVHICAYYKLK